MITQHTSIDTLLKEYINVLGNDFTTYKNHMYRIYNFAILLDNDSKNDEKYAITSFFHDLGIWTHSFDYLAPSIELATEYLTKINKKEWIEEISLMINNHHKITVYTGKQQQTVEIFRKADWVDVVYGVKKFGVTKTDFKAIQKTFPNKGFHLFLLKQSAKYFVKHPLNPLPMFKK